MNRNGKGGHKNTGKTDPRKVSVYLPSEYLAEIRSECERQDRSLSWILQRAWQLARSRIVATPDLPESP